MRNFFFTLICVVSLCQGVTAQTQADLNVLISACEFFGGRNLSSSEKGVVASELQRDFATNPSKAQAEIQELRQLGTLLSQTQDPTKLVEFRQAGLYAAYQDLANGKATPTTKLILQKADPVAADPQNQLLLLRDDLQGATEFLSLLQQMQGGAALNSARKQEFQAQAVSQFANLPSETKGLLVNGRILWVLANQKVAQWNQQKQAQFAQQFAPATGNSEGYQTLSTVSRNQHLSTMNILENMGDSGGYWDYVEQPGW